MDASIIIPTRDRAAWLPTCLAHLEQQTFPAARFEIIVVDDGSMDDTYSVLQRYAQGAPVRIRPIRTERAGFAAARNKGVALATGTMLLFFAEDELASPRLLENHWRAHRGPHGECCLAGEIHIHPQLSPDSFTRLSINDSPDHDEYAEQVLYLDAQPSNLSISRALFEQTGGFDEVEGLSPLEHLSSPTAWARPGLKSVGLPMRAPMFGSPPRWRRSGRATTIWATPCSRYSACRDPPPSWNATN